MTEATEGAGEAPVVDTAAALAAEFGQSPEAAPEAAAENDPPGDDAAAPEPEAEAGAPAKPKQTAKERIDELTWRLRETERREQALLDRIISPPTVGPQPKAAAFQTDDDPEPNPEEYGFGESDTEYVKELALWGGRQGYRAEAAKHAQAQQAQTAATTYAEREAAAKAKHPDFDEVVVKGAEANAWICTADMAQAIKTSEVGPEVAYHLASHPDEAQRIAGLEPVAQIREIGRIEARLETPAPAKTAKTATEAPEPPPTVRGQGGRFKAAPDTADFKAFEEAYP